MVSRRNTRNTRNLQRKKRSTRRSYRKQRGGIVRVGRSLCIKKEKEMGLSNEQALIECAKDEKLNEYEDQWNINKSEDTIYG